MGEEQEYNASFKDNRLYISQKGLKKLSKREDMYVPPNHIRLYCHHSRVFRGPYYGYCFEKACTQPKTEKPHGTFFSVVRRKISDLTVIMAGEIDCSKGMHSDQSVDVAC